MKNPINFITVLSSPAAITIPGICHFFHLATVEAISDIIDRTNQRVYGLT